jgi:hypothetical protein
MGMTMQQKHIAAAVTAVLVLLIIAFVAYHHNQWMKKNCVCTKSAFHGWRGQHYVDNPYNGQNYQCGKGHADPLRDRFAADSGHWPTSGTFGNLADTNPYGNYAGHADMWYPTYNEVNSYWTRS